ncbi:hypothetical protein DMP23_47500 [Amycolatopsis sp. A1MSW2902]|uniref:aldo/keto reductase n=1 Tax=Amycolatopsis sp. A1MSW2902 TaxID=687413 RepID=UPI00307E8C3A
MRGSRPRVVLGLHRSRHDRLILEHALAAGVRAIDTAFNYRGFGSHRTLAAAAADLLAEFAVSTKVGFFPGPAGTPVHSLDPVRLRDALDESAATLDLVPETVFLHNPERALTSTDPAENLDRLAAAAAVLAQAKAAGLCRSWGVSTWDARPLAAAVTDAAAAARVPAPQVLMTRAGLLVAADVLDAAEHLAGLYGLDTGARWGMSPFGGQVQRPVWKTLDPRGFLAPHQNATVAQALLRVAYVLPPVGRMAVGTDDPAHLDELLAAAELDVDEQRIARYRELLRARAVSAAAR